MNIEVTFEKGQTVAFHAKNYLGDTGANDSPTIEFLMQYNLQPGGLGLTVQEKADLVAFLKTLTDSEFLTNPAFKTPF